MAKVLCLTEKEVTMQIPYSGSASPLLFVKGASPHFTVSSPTDGDNWAFHNFITRIQPPAVVNGTEQLRATLTRKSKVGYMSQITPVETF